jgi:hypothetical protein
MEARVMLTSAIDVVWRCGARVMGTHVRLIDRDFLGNWELVIQRVRTI